MQTIELEAEIMQISRYCEIIIQILYMNSMMSLLKLITFAYIIKTGKHNLYTARSSKELAYKSISLISGDYKNFINDTEVILKAIHILSSNKRIKIENSMVKAVHIVSVLNQIYEKNSFIYKAINESKKMSDRQFLKEVISNV